MPELDQLSPVVDQLLAAPVAVFDYRDGATVTVRLTVHRVLEAAALAAQESAKDVEIRLGGSQAREGLQHLRVLADADSDFALVLPGADGGTVRSCLVEAVCQQLGLALGNRHIRVMGPAPTEPGPWSGCLRIGIVDPEQGLQPLDIMLVVPGPDGSLPRIHRCRRDAASLVLMPSDLGTVSGIYVAPGEFAEGTPQDAVVAALQEAWGGQLETKTPLALRNPRSLLALCGSKPGTWIGPRVFCALPHLFELFCYRPSQAALDTVLSHRLTAWLSAHPDPRLIPTLRALLIADAPRVVAPGRGTIASLLEKLGGPEFHPALDLRALPPDAIENLLTTHTFEAAAVTAGTPASTATYWLAAVGPDAVLAFWASSQDASRETLAHLLAVPTFLAWLQGAEGRSAAATLSGQAELHFVQAVARTPLADLAFEALTREVDPLRLDGWLDVMDALCDSGHPKALQKAHEEADREATRIQDAAPDAWLQMVARRLPARTSMQKLFILRVLEDIAGVVQKAPALFGDIDRLLSAHAEDASVGASMLNAQRRLDLAFGAVAERSVLCKTLFSLQADPDRARTFVCALCEKIDDKFTVQAAVTMFGRLKTFPEVVGPMVREQLLTLPNALCRRLLQALEARGDQEAAILLTKLVEHHVEASVGANRLAALLKAVDEATPGPWVASFAHAGVLALAVEDPGEATLRLSQWYARGLLAEASVRAVLPLLRRDGATVLPLCAALSTSAAFTDWRDDGPALPLADFVPILASEVAWHFSWAPLLCNAIGATDDVAALKAIGKQALGLPEPERRQVIEALFREDFPTWGASCLWGLMGCLDGTPLELADRLSTLLPVSSAIEFLREGSEFFATRPALAASWMDQESAIVHPETHGRRLCIALLTAHEALVGPVVFQLLANATRTRGQAARDLSVLSDLLVALPGSPLEAIVLRLLESLASDAADDAQWEAALLLGASLPALPGDLAYLSRTAQAPPASVEAACIATIGHLVARYPSFAARTMAALMDAHSDLPKEGLFPAVEVASSSWNADDFALGWRATMWIGLFLRSLVIPDAQKAHALLGDVLHSVRESIRSADLVGAEGADQVAALAGALAEIDHWPFCDELAADLYVELFARVRSSGRGDALIALVFGSSAALPDAPAESLARVTRAWSVCDAPEGGAAGLEEAFSRLPAMGTRLVGRVGTVLTTICAQRYRRLTPTELGAAAVAMRLAAEHVSELRKAARAPIPRGSKQAVALATAEASRLRKDAAEMLVIVRATLERIESRIQNAEAIDGASLAPCAALLRYAPDDRSALVARRILLDLVSSISPPNAVLTFLLRLFGAGGTTEAPEIVAAGVVSVLIEEGVRADDDRSAYPGRNDGKAYRAALVRPCLRLLSAAGGVDLDGALRIFACCALRLPPPKPTDLGVQHFLGLADPSALWTLVGDDPRGQRIVCEVVLRCAVDAAATATEAARARRAMVESVPALMAWLGHVRAALDRLGEPERIFLRRLVAQHDVVAAHRACHRTHTALRCAVERRGREDSRAYFVAIDALVRALRLLRR